MRAFYRACLRLYPGEFRDEYGRELSLVLADRLRHEPSAVGRLLVWLHALGGILIEAPIEHLRVLTDDVLHAVRVIRREPGSTVAAVAMLGVGLGSATLVFSLANGLLLRPLPYKEPSRLIAIDEYSPKDGASGTVALPNYADFRARTRLLDGIGVYLSNATILRGGAAPELVKAARVTEGTFAVLGVAPALGRVFAPDEARPNGPMVVMIGAEIHRRRFGSDPAIVGKTLETLNARYTIIGVMPAGFHFPDAAQVWFPLRLDPATAARTDYFLKGIGRVKPGVSVDQASAELAAMLTQIHAEHQPNNGWIARARPFRDIVAGKYRGGVLTLLAAAALLLAIACGNVANLLLVKSAGRRREIAVRTALGATRRRLIRQMVTESLVLGAAGGAVGVALAYYGVPAIVGLVPIDLPLWMDFSVDGRVLAFGALLSVATSIIFGTVPALNLSRTAIAGTLKDAGRGTTPGRWQRRLRHTVVIGELALSLTLLAGASLAARSFMAVRLQALGYNTRDVLAMDLAAREAAYATPAAMRALVNRIADDVRPLPGVTSVAFTSGAPLDDGWGRLFTVEGQPVDLQAMTFINHIVVTPGYFRTLDIPLLHGRDFEESDFGGKHLIVSRAFAARHFGSATALGRRVRFGPPKNAEPWFTIVGVVADSRHNVLKGVERDSVYLPYADDLIPETLLVRGSTDITGLTDAITARIRAIDPDIAVEASTTLDQLIDRLAWQDRLLAILFAAFALLALGLAASGFYAVLAYTVSLQTHEIGVRMALGASASSVRGMILRQAMTLAGAGLALGLVAAATLAYLLRTQLYNVSPLDPVSYIVAPAVFLLTGLLAASIPSRRATRVDPLVALRHE